MDEIEMFASLRPAGASIDVLVRNGLRAELFGASPGARSSVDGQDVASSVTDGASGRAELLVLADERVSRRVGPRSSVLTVAAAAVLVLGAVGVWSVAQRDTSNEPAATTTESVSLTQADLAPPRPAIDDPLWLLTHLDDNDFDADTGAVFEPSSKFDGPSAVIETWSESGDAELGPTASVSIGASVGTTSSDDSAAVVEWTDGQGNRLRVFGVSLAVDTVVEIARTVSVQNGRATFAELPGGLVAAEATVVESLGRSIEYQFKGPGTDTLDVRTYAGGAFANRARVAGEDRTAMPLGVEEFLVADLGDGRYRANTIRGFWAWEFDGSGFASAAEFLAFVGEVRVVDEQTWQSALPSSVVGSGSRAADVNALLADVPIPPNVDMDALRTSDSSESRYPFIVAVSGSLVCGWLDVWFDAEAAGDQARMGDAATALASSRNWTMLVEIAAQGGWSDVVWQWADAVNGGPGVASGAGPQPPTRDAARSALGCQF